MREIKPNQGSFQIISCKRERDDILLEENLLTLTKLGNTFVVYGIRDHSSSFLCVDSVSATSVIND